MDIISLSLGFEKNPVEIEESITAVHNNVLIFGAASNNGMSRKHPNYPARDDRVICVHSAFPNGAKSNDNPPAEGGKDLMTLGQDVSSAWPERLLGPGNRGSKKEDSGTSIATAVLASTAGLLLELLRQEHNDSQMIWAAGQLKKTPAMKLVLRDMSQECHHKYRYVEPFLYLDGSGEETNSSVYSRKTRVQIVMFTKLLELYRYSEPHRLLKVNAAEGQLASLNDVSRASCRVLPTLRGYISYIVACNFNWMVEDRFDGLRDLILKHPIAGVIRHYFPIQSRYGKLLLNSRSESGRYWDHLTTAGLEYYTSIHSGLFQDFTVHFGASMRN